MLWKDRSGCCEWTKEGQEWSKETITVVEERDDGGSHAWIVMIKNLAKHVWNNRSTFAERSVKPPSTTLSILPIFAKFSRTCLELCIKWVALMNEKIETKSGECEAIKKLVTSMSSYGKWRSYIIRWPPRFSSALYTRQVQYKFKGKKEKNLWSMGEPEKDFWKYETCLAFKMFVRTGKFGLYMKHNTEKNSFTPTPTITLFWLTPSGKKEKLVILTTPKIEAVKRGKGWRRGQQVASLGSFLIILIIFWKPF